MTDEVEMYYEALPEKSRAKAAEIALILSGLKAREACEVLLCILKIFKLAMTKAGIV
ncbi:MAG: hypothetical protein LBB86_01205 [Oscillospiraceae bacterium]|jgi:hypothetical protein|nr:hypothetical protein [Oscillospiraceae bacterium]